MISSASAPAPRPNVVLMIAHDLGRHLGCYGAKTVRSPHLDALAARGVRFANSFCAAPQCSPSRAALFTGRAPLSNGVMGLTHGLFAWDLGPDEQHLAAILQGEGYHTALLGLQHETRNPHRVGFDQIVPALPPTPEMPNGGDRVALQVGQWLENQDESSPFYLQIGFFEPHRAPDSPEQFGPMAPDTSLGVEVPPYIVDDEAARREFAAYQGAIHTLDGAVGRILGELDARGLRENTLVIFTTDHGIPFARAKCSLYDAGLEICLLMDFPRGGWPQQVIEPMVSNIDVLPTLLECLDIKTPENVEGRSFAPLLRGEKGEERTEIFGEMTYHDYYDPMRCIRTATHKLIVSFTPNNIYMDPSQQRQPRHAARGYDVINLPRHPLVELFDLQNDPHELRNLANDEVLSEFIRELKRELLGRLEAWMRATNDPLLQGVPTPPMHLMALQELSSARDIQ